MMIMSRLKGGAFRLFTTVTKERWQIFGENGICPSGAYIKNDYGAVVYCRKENLLLINPNDDGTATILFSFAAGPFEHNDFTWL